MIPKRITVANGDVGDWVPLNRRSRDHVGVTVNPHASAGGSYTVKYTQSGVNRLGPSCTFSRAGTTLTVGLENHGLSTSDQVSFKSGDYNGVFDVASVTNDDVFTVTLGSAVGSSNKGNAQPIIVSDLNGFSAVTGQVDGQIDASVIAIRLDCTSSTGGPHDLLINQY